MDPSSSSSSKKKGSAKSQGKGKKSKSKSGKKRRHHIPRSDLQLLGSKAGIRLLIRRIGSKYGNTRVSKEAIEIIRENGGKYTTEQLMIVIDIASKSASLNERKTVLASDMNLAIHALVSISSK